MEMMLLIPIILIIVLLLAYFMLPSNTPAELLVNPELLTNPNITNVSFNLDTYGNAIAKVVKTNQHYDYFKQLVASDPNSHLITPTVFDGLYWFQKNNWLSKTNVSRILNNDVTDLDKTQPNAY